MQATITFISSDPSKVVIENGVARAVATGSAEITAASGAVRSEQVPVRVDAAGASGSDLIAAALRANRITADVALKYRVYAQFGDPRLPFEFQGNRPPRFDRNLMLTLFQRLPLMAAADAADLQPYTVAPIYPNSWYYAQRGPVPQPPTAVRATAAGRVTAQAARPGACVPSIASDWRNLDTPNFRIWYDSRSSADAGASAQAARAVIEAIRTRLVSELGMRAPLPDTNVACNGGDGRVDVYIVPPTFVYQYDDATGAAAADISGAYGVTPSEITVSGARVAYPGFILLNENYIRGIFNLPAASVPSCSGANCYLIGTLAHEFFHTVQGAYRFDHGEALWLMDSTADWAIDHFAPGNQLEQAEWAVFQQNQDTPLWFPNKYPDAGDPQVERDQAQKMYGSSMFFTYLTRASGPAVIPALFAALETAANSLHALDAAIPGGLAQAWHRFAIKAYNRAPVTADAQSFPNWDNYTRAMSLEVGGPHPAPQVIDLGSDFVKTYSAAVDLRQMSIQVVRFDFSSDLKSSSVAFFNGWSFQASRVNAVFSDETTALPTNAAAGPMLFAAELAADRKPGRGLWAVIKTADGARRIEDWSDRPMGLLCKDDNGSPGANRPNENVDELTLIFSNGWSLIPGTSSDGDTDSSAAQMDLRKRKAVDQPFTLVASRTPCGGYEGSATSQWTATDATTQQTLTSRLTLSGTFTPDRSALIQERIDGVTQRRLFFMDQLLHRWTEGSLQQSLTGTYCGASLNVNQTEVPNPAENIIRVWPAILPGGAHAGAAASTVRRNTWLLPTCAGVARETPEQRAFNLNLNLAAGQFTPFFNDIGTINLVNQQTSASSPSFGTVNITTNACFRRVIPGFPAVPSCP
ncbi:MAG: hypothetical protein U5L03_09375 [Burkholderiaceae bacterium]|nr:hypothetical protein [Burkholderiaceae bacterium]